MHPASPNCARRNHFLKNMGFQGPAENFSEGKGEAPAYQSRVCCSRGLVEVERVPMCTYYRSQNMFVESQLVYCNGRGNRDTTLVKKMGVHAPQIYETSLKRSHRQKGLSTHRGLRCSTSCFRVRIVARSGRRNCKLDTICVCTVVLCASNNELLKIKY